jgi:hypothetical protein
MMFIYVSVVYVSSDPGTYIVRIRFAFQKPGVTICVCELYAPEKRSTRQTS